MKILRLHIYFVILLIMLVSCNETNTRNYLQYVNPLIGTASAISVLDREISGEDIESGQTIPAVSAPFGMTQWTPQVQSSEKKCMSPFYFGRIRFQGFRGTHWLNGSCSKDYGSFTIFPTNLKNNFRFLPNQRETMYMYNSDIATPAYFSVFMPEQNIITEVTATKRCGFFKFSWMDPNYPTIIIDVNSDEGKGFIKVDIQNKEIYGYNPVCKIVDGDNKPSGISGYFVAKFDTQFEKTGTFAGMNYEHKIDERKNQKEIGAYVIFDLKNNNAPVKMKIGTSFTSLENARKNLDVEIPNWDFTKTKINLENVWNEILGRIDVESDNENEVVKFYTAMYHSLLQPRLYSDANGEYPGFADDTLIHVAKGFDYYGDFLTGYIYSSQMSLVSLISPKEYCDMVQSLIVKAEQGSWLPTSPMQNNYTSLTIGDFSTSIIANAFIKGFDFDIEKAYKYMRKNAFEIPNIEYYNVGKGRRLLNSYLQFGYIPIEDEVLNEFQKAKQVSRTLSFAYNDWCLAKVADKLGKTEDYDELMERATNYINILDLDNMRVSGKFADGSFTTEFESPKQYIFYVPHDIDGLIEQMGDERIFQQELSKLFTNKEYCHKLEFGHQIPYFFNFVDDWENTQTTVKNLLATEYGSTPDGIPGNDNGGQKSAWYVFSAVGFYPICPGSNEYQLSSPIFEKVTLNLDKEYYPGGKFTFETAPGNNFEIFNTVKLNGNLIDTKITHEDLQEGGSLIFSNEEDK